MKERIKNIMSIVFEEDLQNLKDDSSPDSLEKWDSLNHMNLVTALEEEFKVKFNDEEISEMLNLKLIELILKNKGINQ